MKKGDNIGPAVKPVKSPSGSGVMITPYQSTFVCDFKPVETEMKTTGIVREVNMHMKSEEKSALCMTCMRVVMTKVFYIVAMDAEGKEWFVRHFGTNEPFQCIDCMIKEK